MRLPKSSEHVNFAAALLDKYGEDSLAYLVLEQDKQYFFGKKVEGVIAFRIIGKVAVCAGDPICAKALRERLLKEFHQFCRGKRLKICFCSISQSFAQFLQKQNFCIAKYGEEAILNLPTYQTVGSKTAKLRQKLRRAENCGVQVIEYHPQEKRNIILEGQVYRISEEWFAGKNGRLTFTLGDLNFDNPLKRRYFLSVGAEGEVYAILVFLPFACGKGYFLDVMRRKSDAIPGVMEKAIIDAGMKMKAEGVQWLSLGLAPLAGLNLGECNKNFLERSMHFIYQNMNHGYKFQALYDYKRKFSPCRWEPRYIAHESRLTPLQTGYVMIKARNVTGVWQQLLRGLWRAKGTLLRPRLKFDRYTIRRKRDEA